MGTTCVAAVSLPLRVHQEHPIGWKDSAAAFAVLFLNFFYFHLIPAPFTLLHRPIWLAVVACTAGLVAALAFYLSARGSRDLDPGLPMRTRIGKLTYVIVVFLLAAPLCSALAATLSWALEDWWMAVAKLEGRRLSQSALLLESILWIAWAAWIASRGRMCGRQGVEILGLGRLAILVGGCLRFWKEIAVFGDISRYQTHLAAAPHDVSQILASVLPFALLSGLVAPGRPRELKRAVLIGVGGGLAATVLLLSVMLGGFSSVVPAGDLLQFRAGGSIGQDAVRRGTIAGSDANCPCSAPHQHIGCP